MKIECVNCNGELELDDDQLFFRCPYCSSSLMMDFSGTLRHLILKPLRIPTQPNIHQLLGHWLKEKEVIAKIRISQIRFSYFPFWLHIDKKGASHLFPAFSGHLLDINRLRVPPGDFTDFDGFTPSQEFTVIEPDISLESSRGILQNFKSIDPESIKESRLLHVPFCEVVYRNFGRLYSLLLDINANEIHAESEPPSAQKVISLAMTLIALGLFVVFLLIGLALPDFISRLIAFLLIGSGLYFIVQKIIITFGI